LWTGRDRYLVERYKDGYLFGRQRRIHTSSGQAELDTDGYLVDRQRWIPTGQADTYDTYRWSARDKQLVGKLRTVLETDTLWTG
jgi:hypothetical protein